MFSTGSTAISESYMPAKGKLNFPVFLPGFTQGWKFADAFGPGSGSRPPIVRGGIAA
jgi:hypothetical protein